MADLTFKANLLPSTDLGKALGSSTQRWNIYGNLTGNADTATELSNTPNHQIIQQHFFVVIILGVILLLVQLLQIAIVMGLFYRLLIKGLTIILFVIIIMVMFLFLRQVMGYMLDMGIPILLIGKMDKWFYLMIIIQVLELQHQHQKSILIVDYYKLLIMIIL